MYEPSYLVSYGLDISLLLYEKEDFSMEYLRSLISHKTKKPNQTKQ